MRLGGICCRWWRLTLLQAQWLETWMRTCMCVAVIAAQCVYCIAHCDSRRYDCRVRVDTVGERARRAAGLPGGRLAPCAGRDSTHQCRLTLFPQQTQGKDLASAPIHPACSDHVVWLCSTRVAMCRCATARCPLWSTSWRTLTPMIHTPPCERSPELRTLGKLLWSGTRCVR